jgi:hypothetical protein
MTAPAKLDVGGRADAAAAAVLLIGRPPHPVIDVVEAADIDATRRPQQEI